MRLLTCFNKTPFTNEEVLKRVRADEENAPEDLPVFNFYFVTTWRLFLLGVILTHHKTAVKRDALFSLKKKNQPTLLLLVT